MRKNILVILAGIFAIIILALSIRGLPGNPTATELNSPMWKDEGPFELSPDRGRFALLYSIAEDDSIHFSLPLARFATPDLGRINGNYVSLFAPLMSYILVPGYVIGKALGASQVGTFAVISVFALINVFLIRAIAIKLGSNKIAATLAGLIFLFATPGFAYAVSLYQHHISTFFILVCLYILLKTNKVWSLSIIWFMFGLSLPLDYPNAFLLLPIALASVGKAFSVDTNPEKIKIKIKLLAFVTILTAIIPTLFFFWFNNASYGSPARFLGGNMERVKAIGDDGLPVPIETIESKPQTPAIHEAPTSNSLFRFFDSRNMLSGLTIHTVSRDRGIFVYTPIMAFAIFGAIVLYRKKASFLSILVAVIGINICLYSMWSDPWGGWAFGSRYLIPSFALFSILIAVGLSAYSKRLWFMIPFIVILSYSVLVNTLGALTTNRIPPQVEAAALSKLSGVREKYSYDRNIQYLDNGSIKSFAYQAWAGQSINSWQYYQLVSGTIIVVLGGLSVGLYLTERKRPV